MPAAGLAALACLCLLAAAANAPAHAHTFDIGAHAHPLAVGAHTHPLAVGAHTHPLAVGIHAHTLGARAHAAGVISVDDTGRLRFTGESNGELIEEGPATGTLPGSVRARLTLGTNVTLGFTIYLHGGSISGSGAAKLNPGKGVYASFNGTLNVSHGSGHYAHASGSGGLYGTIDRENDNATVQVVGHLHV
jgi:hypothetical protein